MKGVRKNGRWVWGCQMIGFVSMEKCEFKEYLFWIREMLEKYITHLADSLNRID